MTIKTRVMGGKKQSTKYMFERMVQHNIEEQTGESVYASGIAYNEACDMWFFKVEALNIKGAFNAFNTYEGYISCLGKVVITKVNGERKTA